MRKSNTEEFIKKAKFIHGNKYDYSLVQYLNNKTNFVVINQSSATLKTQKLFQMT